MALARFILGRKLKLARIKCSLTKLNRARLAEADNLTAINRALDKQAAIGDPRYFPTTLTRLREQTLAKMNYMDAEIRALRAEAQAIKARIEG